MKDLKLEFKLFFSWKNIILASLIGLLLVSYIFLSVKSRENTLVFEENQVYNKYLQQLFEEKFQLKTDQDLVDKMIDSLNEVIIDVEMGDRKKIVSDLMIFYELASKYKNNPLTAKHLEIGEAEIDSQLKYLGELKAKGLSLERDVYSLKSANLFKTCLELSQSSFFIIAMLLVLMNSLGADFTSGSFMLRKTSPSKRISYYVSKVIASLLYFLMTYSFVAFWGIILCMCIGDGFGSLTYPIKIGPLFDDKLNYFFKIMPIGLYSFKMITYYLLYAGFSISLYLFFISLIKEEMVSLCLLSGILLLANNHYKDLLMIKKLGILPSELWLNPLKFSYAREMVYDFNLNWTFTIFIGLLAIFIVILLVGFMENLAFVQNFRLALRRDLRDSYFTSYEQKANSFFLLKFELKKIFARKEVYSFTMALAFIVISLSLGQKLAYREAKDRLYDSLLSGITDIEALIEGNGRPSDKNMYRGILKGYLGAIDLYEKGDKDFVNVAIEAINLLDSKITGDIFYGQTGYTKLIHDKTMDELKKKAIESPIYLTGFYKMTPFDQDRNFFQSMEYTRISEYYHDSQAFVLDKLLTSSGIYLVFGLLSFILGVGLCLELGRSRSIEFMNLSPVASKTLVLSKILAQAIGLMLIVLVSLFVSHLSMTATASPLDLNYPKETYSIKIDKDKSDTQLPRKDFIGVDKTKITKDTSKVSLYYQTMFAYNFKSILLIVCSLAFTITLSYYLSTFIESRYIMTSLTFVILLLGYFISEFVLKGFSFISPFTWLKADDIASGIKEVRYASTMFSWYIGVLILGFWTLILYNMSKARYKKIFRR